MGLFDFYKRKKIKETLETSEQPLLVDGNTSELSDELYDVVSDSEKKEYGLGYIEEKLEGLREQAERYSYQQEYVPTYYMDDESFIERMKMRIEDLWKKVLILLLFRDGNFSEHEDIDMDEIKENIENMSPGLQKTIVKNLVQKLEGEQNVVSSKIINNADALISSAKSHLSVLQDQLKTIIFVLEEIERPDTLSVDNEEKSYQLYEEYYRKIAVHKLRLERTIQVFEGYITTTEKLYARKFELEQTQADKIEEKIRREYVFRNTHNPTLLAIEKKKLEVHIEKTKEPVENKRNELSEEIEHLEKEKLQKTINMLDTQWKRMYHKMNKKSGTATMIYYHVEGRIAENNSSKTKEETCITKVTVKEETHTVEFAEITDQEMIAFLENEDYKDWEGLEKSLSDRNIENIQLSLFETLSPRTQVLREAQKNWDIENNNIEAGFFDTLDEFAQKNVRETKEYTEVCGIKIASEEVMHEAIQELFGDDTVQHDYNYYKTERTGITYFKTEGADKTTRPHVQLKDITTYKKKHGEVKYNNFSLASRKIVDGLLNKLPGKNEKEKKTALLYLCPQLYGRNWLADTEGNARQCLGLLRDLESRYFDEDKYPDVRCGLFLVGE